MKKTQDTLMVDLARFIEEHCQVNLSLAKLSKQAGLSTTHLQKRFKAHIGVSPKEFQEACRLKRFKTQLRNKKSITEAVYDSGHGSTSRIYERLDQRVGMTPKQYQRKGEGLEISYASGATPLGRILIGATDRGICFLQFAESDKKLIEMLKDEFPKATFETLKRSNQGQFKRWLKDLNDYLAGTLAKLDLPLDVQGTAFQLSVWKYLQKIPRGKVLSYTELAVKLGKPSAVRAVASACAKNNIAVVIPCHRVLRGTGELAGYRWGLERKKKLLELEKGPEGPFDKN